MSSFLSLWLWVSVWFCSVRLKPTGLNTTSEMSTKSKFNTKGHKTLVSLNQLLKVLSTSLVSLCDRVSEFPHRFKNELTCESLSFSFKHQSGFSTMLQGCQSQEARRRRLELLSLKLLIYIKYKLTVWSECLWRNTERCFQVSGY